MARLCISIPLYNKHDELIDTLSVIVPYVLRYGIKIAIFDDSDHTVQRHNFENYVSSLMVSGCDISYKKNIYRLGHDLNVVTALQNSNADYVWLISDGLSIVPEILVEIIDNLVDVDFLFLNTRAVCLEHYSNQREFIQNSAWYLTMTGATIYSANIISLMKSTLYIQSRNFPQLSLILLAFSTRRVLFRVINDKCAYLANSKVSYWLKDSIAVFSHDWVEVLSPYRVTLFAESWRKVTASHCKNTGLLAFKNLIVLRSSKLIDFSQVISNIKYIRLSTTTPFVFVLLISIAPRQLIKTIVELGRKFKCV